VLLLYRPICKTAVTADPEKTVFFSLDIEYSRRPSNLSRWPRFMSAWREVRSTLLFYSLARTTKKKQTNILLLACGKNSGFRHVPRHGHDVFQVETFPPLVLRCSSGESASRSAVLREEHRITDRVYTPHSLQGLQAIASARRTRLRLNPQLAW
jgi:hypothetical protein